MFSGHQKADQDSGTVPENPERTASDPLFTKYLRHLILYWWKEYFTATDICDTYHSLPSAKKSRKYTAYVTPFGNFKYNVTPYGATNSPFTLAKLMETVLGEAYF